MALIDTLTAQAQQAQLKEAPFSGLADAFATGVKLRQADDALGIEQLKLAQKQSQISSQFMAKEVELLSMAGNIEKPSGARKNYLEAASVMRQKWMGQPYSEDFKKLMVSDVDTANRFSSIFAGAVRAGADPQAIANELMKVNGPDAAIEIERIAKAYGPFATMLGRANQGRGTSSAPGLRVYEGIRNQLEANLAKLRDPETMNRRGLQPSVANKAIEEISAVLGEAPILDQKGMLDPAQQRKLTDALAQATRYVGAAAGAAKASEKIYEETEKNTDRKIQVAQDWGNYLEKWDKETVDKVSATGALESAIARNDAKAVSQLVSTLRPALNEAGIFSNKDADRISIDRSLVGDVRAAAAYLLGNPDLKEITPQQQKQFSGLLKYLKASAVEKQSALLASEYLNRAKSINPVEKGVFKPGGEQFKETEDKVNFLRSKAGLSPIKLNDLVKGRQASAKKNEVQAKKQKKEQIEAQYQERLNKIKNSSLPQEEKAKQIKALNEMMRSVKNQ